jgi:tetratricopeptide (TPR) repeat protein
MLSVGLVFLLSPATRSEVITLKTGEKIRGKILSKEDGRLVVQAKTRRVEVELDKVSAIEERVPLLDEFHAQVYRSTDTDADRFFKLSLWCSDKGLFDLQVDVLHWVIGLDPDHEKARAALGFFRAPSGKWVKGKAKNKPGGDSLFKKALTLYKKGEDSKAIAVLKQILADAPDDLDARYLMGEIYYATGKLGHAKKEFEAVVKADVEWPWGHYGLALVSLKSKRYAEAEGLAKKALTLTNDMTPPNHRKAAEAEFYYVLGRSHRHRGASRRMEAEKAYQDAVKRDRRHFRAWTELGILAGSKGKYKEAFNAYGKALSAESNYIPARFNWGVGLYRSGKLQEAVMKLTPLTRAQTFHVEALKIIGRCYHRFNDTKRAFRYYTQYLSKGGKDRRVSQWIREVKR